MNVFRRPKIEGYSRAKIKLFLYVDIPSDDKSTAHHWSNSGKNSLPFQTVLTMETLYLSRMELQMGEQSSERFFQSAWLTCPTRKASLRFSLDTAAVTRLRTLNRRQPSFRKIPHSRSTFLEFKPPNLIERRLIWLTFILVIPGYFRFRSVVSQISPSVYIDVSIIGRVQKTIKEKSKLIMVHSRYLYWA